MFVLGTAGHVDHGKSSLLRALTGMQPERLPEEKRRGMTIDLGFVWLTIGEARVGIVDVPGHERFVKNMISGVSHVDAFLFVVAADDGWMPQSEEHLKLLHSLGVRNGILVISKADLVTQERLARVSEDALSRMSNRLGARPPLVVFSAPTGQGREEIEKELNRLIAKLTPPAASGVSRLWVDRVFLPKGEGVVVTGTLRGGSVSLGDELLLFPGEMTASVKSLESYREKSTQVAPTSRLALGLARIKKTDVARGTLLVKSRRISSTKQFDARVNWFEKAPRKNISLTLHYGTTHGSALVIPFKAESGGGFCRIKLGSEVPLLFGDRFVLRLPGEERSEGTGVVLDPSPGKMSLAKQLPRLQALELSERGWVRHRFGEKKRVALSQLMKESWFSEESLRKSCVFEGLLESEPGVFVSERRVSVTPDSGELSPIAKSLLEKFEKAENEIVDLSSGAKDKSQKEAVVCLVSIGKIVSLADGIFIGGRAYEQIKKKVVARLQKDGACSTSDLKTELALNRKHAVLVLERLDRDRVTFLKDGARRLLKP